jgi:hypothetical protein
VPIVSSRRSFFISFAVPLLNNTLPLVAAGSAGADTCDYPGTLWTKTVDTLDCNDIYSASIPWSQNKFCGFVQDLDASAASPDWAIYKVTLVTEYIEIYKMFDKTYQRISQFSYIIAVKFRTQQSFSSNTLNVFIADSTVTGFVGVELTSDAVYDVASGNVLVQFLTTAAWPYQLDADNPSFVSSLSPALPGLSAEITNLDYDSYGRCDTQQDSLCTQKWFVRINVAANCDVSGLYTFQDTLDCRDVNSTSDLVACPAWATPVQFSIRIMNTDLCAPAVLDATQFLQAELTAYFDAEHENEAETYQTGDAVYWVVTVKDPQGTIDRIELAQLEVDLVSSTDSTVSEGVDVLFSNDLLTTAGNATQFAFANVEAQVSVGHTARLYISFRWLRSGLPNTVGQLSAPADGEPVLQVDLRTSLTLNFFYHGNQKRATMNTPNTLTVHHDIHVTNAVEVVDEATEGDDDETLFDVDESSASVNSFVVNSFFVVVVGVAVCFHALL